MKKLLLLSGMIAGFAFSAVADGPKGDFGMKLTDNQKACIEKAGCPKMEKPDFKGEKPDFKKGEKPVRQEPSDEEKEKMKEARECHKKAFEACGIEMPEKGPKGEKGSRK
ncbi:hypothetical protein FACS18945_3410 [Bacteroidia bacterium]|nr:hypothetical protein FACS18945_3410 [Bacteroidia bacterium]